MFLLKTSISIEPKEIKFSNEVDSVKVYAHKRVAENRKMSPTERYNKEKGYDKI